MTSSKRPRLATGQEKIALKEGGIFQPTSFREIAAMSNVRGRDIEADEFAIRQSQRHCHHIGTASRSPRPARGSRPQAEISSMSTAAVARRSGCVRRCGSVDKELRE